MIASAQTSKPIPVHLVTGLLGSGKTTTTQKLIKQKPPLEKWGLLINEFGEIDMDAAILRSQSSNTSLIVREVRGGCVCCTAQFSLIQAVNQLLKNDIDRLIIEPTGLGHPAQILDTLKQPGTFKQPLSLRAVICLITPQQLTRERWQTSKVMRDLVTLADRILLNQCDRAEAAEIETSQKLLASLYPPKSAEKIAFGRVDRAILTESHQPPAFALMHGLQQHQTEAQSCPLPYTSTLPETRTCSVSGDTHNQSIQAIGWIWEPSLQFQRTRLKHFFETFSPQLARAKGLLKTGKEWQLIQWSETAGLQFNDIGWRQDSRLELIFKTGQDNQINPKAIEIQLLSCLHRR